MDKHETDLPKEIRNASNPLNGASTGNNLLFQFIIMDIKSFYSYTHSQFPDIEIPSYWKDLIKFRNKSVAHVDDEFSIELLEKIYGEMNKIGPTKIWNDYVDVRKKVMEILDAELAELGLSAN